MTKKNERFLIIKLSAYGDIIHSLPFFNELRKIYPEAIIDWAVSSKFANLLSRVKGIDNIIEIHSKSWKENFRKIRKEKYDKVFDLQGLLKSGILTFFARGGEKIGFDSGNSREFSSLFYNHKVNVDKYPHVIEKNFRLLGDVVENTVPHQDSFEFSSEEEKFAEDFLETRKLSGKGFVVLNYPAGWESKMWNYSYFAELSELIVEKLNLSVVLSYGPGEEMGASLIQSMCDKTIISIPPDTTIFQTMCIFKKSRVIVSGDTGHLHFSNYLNIPSLGLFGPTFPERNGPYFPKYEVISGLRCEGKCQRKKCKKNRCMNSITVEMVFEKILSLLTEN